MHPDITSARPGADPVPWFEKAAKAGHAGAMSNLGYLFLGPYDPPERATARAWYEKAGADDDVDEDG